VETSVLTPGPGKTPAQKPVNGQIGRDSPAMQATRLIRHPRAASPHDLTPIGQTTTRTIPSSIQNSVSSMGPRAIPCTGHLLA
jgi:hypothetical protein